jgi:hypothetical protein
LKGGDAVSAGAAHPRNAGSDGITPKKEKCHMYPVYQLIDPAIGTPFCLFAAAAMFVYVWLRDR